MVDKRSRRILCTAFACGRKHDLRLYKESGIHIHPGIKVLVDSGYQGMQKRHGQTALPHKHRKTKPLTKEERQQNRQLASDRVANENVIGMLKRFKILSDRYRNRRKRFKLRFNLIAGLYNWELD